MTINRFHGAFMLDSPCNGSLIEVNNRPHLPISSFYFSHSLICIKVQLNFTSHTGPYSVNNVYMKEILEHFQNKPTEY